MTSSSTDERSAAFTVVELLVAVALLGIFMSGLLAMWNALGTTALNTTSYAQRQSDQMRVLDYLKRDIRRATKVELFNGATPVVATGTFGTELRLTVPDYYSDSREEDNAIGTRNTNAPTLSGGNVLYGTSLTVRYYESSGAIVRNEAGALRTIANSSGRFSVSFLRETSGAVRGRVFYDQPMRSARNRTLRRQVDTLCVPRFELQL